MGFREIRKALPWFFNACALRFLFVSVIFHMVVQITKTPSVNFAAQKAICSNFCPSIWNFPPAG
jgi:hypothetical protein